MRLRLGDAVAAIPWRFLVVLGAGITASLLVLAGPIGWLLDHRPVPLFAFFLGLVLASIVTVAARLRWSVTAVLCLLLGAGVAWWLVGLVPTAMPHDAVTLFLSGAAAITAMILPGISGSFILLVLGQYEFVIDAVRDRDFLAILPLAAGAVCGILPFVRVLSWLLRRHRQITIALLIGFMAGSLRRIWPFKEVVPGEWPATGASRGQRDAGTGRNVLVGARFVYTGVPAGARPESGGAGQDRRKSGTGPDDMTTELPPKPQRKGWRGSYP